MPGLRLQRNRAVDRHVINHCLCKLSLLTIWQVLVLIDPADDRLCISTIQEARHLSNHWLLEM